MSNDLKKFIEMCVHFSDLVLSGLAVCKFFNALRFTAVGLIIIIFISFTSSLLSRMFVRQPTHSYTHTCSGANAIVSIHSLWILVLECVQALFPVLLWCAFERSWCWYGAYGKLLMASFHTAFMLVFSVFISAHRHTQALKNFLPLLSSSFGCFPLSTAWNKHSIRHYFNKPTYYTN